MTHEAGEPVIDSIGDVRVRIQGKDDDNSSTIPDLTKDIPNNPESGDGNDPNDGNKGGGGSLV
ncbi:hypothetical protein D3C73_1543910 [compost metagenome]